MGPLLARGTPRVAPVAQGNPFHIDDPVHVAFLQDANGL